jgi:regulator of cell morphogenesis and NO signaling
VEIIAMKFIPTTATKLAELALMKPGASRVLRRAGIDYCCGGQRSLREACEAKSLSAEKVLQEILAEEAPTQGMKPELLSVAGLIQHILKRFHEPLRAELPELVAMARKVEAVHADKPNVPRGLAEHMSDVMQSLLSHMEKEEQVLFPMVLAGHGIRADMPIRVMMQEHDDHALNLQRTRRLTNNFTPPAEACTTWRALYMRLDQMEADLMDHVHLENHVLFPRALRESDPHAAASDNMEGRS